MSEAEVTDMNEDWLCAERYSNGICFMLEITECFIGLCQLSEADQLMRVHDSRCTVVPKTRPLSVMSVGTERN